MGGHKKLITPDYTRHERELTAEDYEMYAICAENYKRNNAERLQKKEEERIERDKQDEIEQKERDKQEYKVFTDLWDSGVAGKLSCYGKVKLCKLAKIKKIKGYSKLSKDELIVLLIPISTKSDFPIKD